MTEETETVEATTVETEVTQTETDTQLTEARVREMLAEAKAEGKAEAEETYKGFQRTVTKTQRENEELRQRLETTPTASTVTQELMVQELKAIDAENPNANSRIATLEHAISLEKQKATKQAEFNTQQAEARTERGKLETQIEDAGFDPAHEDFEDVFESWDLSNKLDGDWVRPQKKLARVLKQKVVKAEPEEEPDAEEKARAEAEKNGTLKTETGSPSTSSGSHKQIAARWLADPDNPVLRKAYNESRLREGI